MTGLLIAGIRPIWVRKRQLEFVYSRDTTPKQWFPFRPTYVRELHLLGHPSSDPTSTTTSILRLQRLWVSFGNPSPYPYLPLSVPRPRLGILHPHLLDGVREPKGGRGPKSRRGHTPLHTRKSFIGRTVYADRRSTPSLTQSHGGGSHARVCSSWSSRRSPDFPFARSKVLPLSK